MKYLVQLPNGDTLPIRYNKDVYNPRYSTTDTIVIADTFIKRGNIQTVLDVGCGSGVLGLSLKYLNPALSVGMCDVDKKAVESTKKNAKLLGLDVSVRLRGLEDAKSGWDMVVANLPTYNLKQMEGTLHGPEGTYYGGRDGLNLYRQLFEVCRATLLVCECQEKHQEKFLKLAKDQGWQLLIQTDFGFAFWKSKSPPKRAVN